MAQQGRFPLTSGYAFRRRGATSSMLLRQQVLFQDRDDTEAQIFADWWLNAAPVDHDLTVTGIATGAPTIGAPSPELNSALSVTGIATDAPTVGSPAVTLDHNLTASGIAAGAPTVGAPEVTVGETVIESPPSPSGGGGGAMQVGRRRAGSGRWVRLDPDPEDKPKPPPRVEHTLQARSISAAPPIIEAPEIRLEHALTACGSAAASPIVGRPTPTIYDDSEVVTILELLEAA